MTPTLSRKDRRAQQASAAKAYGAPGDAGLALHQAYQALAHQDVARAVGLAHAVSQSHPANVHPWLILGIAALEQHEGQTGRAFFERALKIAPRNALALAGLGKALVLQADVFPAVDLFEQAIAAGSEDLSMAQLYVDLMRRMDRPAAAAAALGQMAARMQDAALYLMVAELHLSAEEFGPSARAFEAAWALDPKPVQHRIGHIKALLFRHDFAGVETETSAMLVEFPDLDELASLRMTALRNLGRWDEALAMLDAPFSTPVYYKRALGTAAHVHLDRGAPDQAAIAFSDALHLTDEEHVWAAKAYGTFRFGQGEFAAGLPYYAERQPIASRRRIPYANSAPEALAQRDRLFLMEEQGIGDQLALLPLLRLAPLKPAAKVTFVGDARMGAVLAGNALDIGFIPDAEFDTGALGVAPDETIFLGDLTRVLPERAPLPAPLGGYLRADPGRIAAIRERYERFAEGGPIVGLAWLSRDNMTGYHRSLPLADLVTLLPPGALAVNLQYGDCRAEIAAAAAARPDVTILDDAEVDQMSDLGGFMAQIMALDRVVTIDNTTAHACGALGHPETHVLIPAGAECMWYWGREAARDPWYGKLHLHRQSAPRDWSRPKAELRALWD